MFSNRRLSWLLALEILQFGARELQRLLDIVVLPFPRRFHLVEARPDLVGHLQGVESRQVGERLARLLELLAVEFDGGLQLGDAPRPLGGFLQAVQYRPRDLQQFLVPVEGGRVSGVVRLQVQPAGRGALEGGGQVADFLLQ